MLSEKIIFALNNVDDLYLEEAEELLDKPIASRHAFNKRTLHVLLIAAVLAALLTACAVGYSIHQRRQQELRESLKIEENHVAGYQEFEKAPTPEETTVESEGKTPSVQLISTFRKRTLSTSLQAIPENSMMLIGRSGKEQRKDCTADTRSCLRFRKMSISVRMKPGRSCWKSITMLTRRV